MAAKRLIVCCDGTWNNPEQREVTNVVKTARAVLPAARDGRPQVVFYDRGVGTGNLLDRIEGGALGEGLDANIQDAYRFLVHNWAEGDEIFLFGFSRGAYTARSTAGFIRNCGILRKRHAHLIPDAFRMYRSRAHPDAPAAAGFRRRYAAEVRIRFVGVWDTVGALGIPLRVMQDLNRRRYAFHDTSPSRIIDHACHALAIDERRSDFRPTLWRVTPGARHRVEQVWFTGVHCDVGGGYRETGLSDITLEWMLGRAAEAGLEVDRGYLAAVARPDPMGKRHRSWKGVYWAKGRYVRPIGAEARGMEKVHPSVRRRMEHDPDYRPKNLLRFLKTADDPYWRPE
ncbi:DUF2235 domain-containing protein [Dissulfurirhabdus thermomarina]|uniref:DUF2235 domain-containing protein n=1 Tax=Dissulfurirhabdus thermomarina TaxID=1765737 RepID=A0A6N9TPX0_DISTH|nr:DUF2235 domain-containing protein [Dissulfurirhabdus thermomarina]NDY43088.1 DUF2235 domain-containing protein [Dissulfurirhabdus thermomarina]NMX22695.1 DUF2235 domain-containing protein [Dissulfurirhabdus thermomarina]